MGPYHMEVGFQNEPAISGFQNGVFFEVTQASNGQPVNVSDSLKVSVAFGDQTKDLTFEPIPDNPGQYVAAFIPTQPGAYTFAFSGSINGTPVDLSITSGPETFDEVQNPTDLQFPVREPSVSDVATKLDRETARVTAAAQDAQQSAQAAKDDGEHGEDVRCRRPRGRRARPDRRCGGAHGRPALAPFEQRAHAGRHRRVTLP